jgi:hypothetical protein
MKAMCIVSLTVFLLCSCTTTNRQSPKAPAVAPRGDAASNSLVGEKSWRLKIPGNCTVTGRGKLATGVSCKDLGSASLENAKSKELGRDVGALSTPKEETVGGRFATLSHRNASYRIAFAQWQPIRAKVRTILLQERIEERDAGYAKAPACKKPGEVVHLYDSCPSVAGNASVCGTPILKCGPPLAAGEPCEHNGACKSGKCGFKSGKCE